MRCLVLGIRRYGFKDDGSGERVEGSKISYLTLDAEDEEDSRGEIPLEVSAPRSLFEKFDELPAFYDLDFRQRPGRGGKPTLQIAGLKYSGPASIGDAQTA